MRIFIALCSFMLLGFVGSLYGYLSSLWSCDKEFGLAKRQKKQEHDRRAQADANRAYRNAESKARSRYRMFAEVDEDAVVAEVLTERISEVQFIVHMFCRVWISSEAAVFISPPPFFHIRSCSYTIPNYLTLNKFTEITFKPS